MTPLLVVGAGGFARETAEAVRASNKCGQTWDLLGFLDDDPVLAGRRIAGAAILGPVRAVTDHQDAQIVVCVGRPDNYFSRKRITTSLALPRLRYATVVHPDASIGASAHVGVGTVILAGVVATSDVRVGAHVAIMPSAVLTHDDVVGDFATLGSGVRLGGNVHIGEGAYLGAGCLIREQVTVGPWAMVGMGAAVLQDVPPGEVWAGVPARRLRDVDVPSDLRR